MPTWYEAARDARGNVTITFSPHPAKRWFAPDILRECEFPDVRGGEVTLTGGGAVWMYFHMAYRARMQGANAVRVQRPDGTSVTIYPPPAGVANEWCRYTNPSENEQVVEFSGAQILPEQLSRLPLREDIPLIIGGSGAVWMYAAVGAQAACIPAVLYDSPREPGLVSIGIHQSGAVIPRRAAIDEEGLVIGLVGDPNSGKSVLAKALYEVLRTKVKRSWVCDCDAASPTPNWYLMMLNDQEENKEDVRRMRDDYKVSWSPELERAVGAQLQSLKGNLEITLADLPGGRHPKDGDSFAAERIPMTRTTMFDKVDLFIVLGRSDRPETVDAWRLVLEEYGYGGRVIAELLSCDPFRAPEVQVSRKGLLLSGTVSGLDRGRPRDEVAVALRPFVAELLNSVCWWKLAAQARGATVRAFLTKPGGVRYGAAVLCADGRTFASGQYSSFNHITNVHAEQACLAAAAANGSPDVLALAVASTEPAVVGRPCGVCRQVMSEHAARTGRDFAVIMVDHGLRPERCEVTVVSELLPEPWRSHRQNTAPLQPLRAGQPRLQGFDQNCRLTCGAHVELPGGELALVWDPGFGDASLVKVKYHPQSDGTWDKLPHSLTETHRYLTRLEKLGLATKTFCGAVAALANPEQIKHWVPPCPVLDVHCGFSGPLRDCFRDVGIVEDQVLYTGSRALGLSESASDHDLVIRATPEQIRAFRERCAVALQRGDLNLPKTSGTWALLDRVFPGGQRAVIDGRRFLETVHDGEHAFSLMFAPMEAVRLEAQGWDRMGWTTLSGSVNDASHAAYKRACFHLHTSDGRRVEVVSYHKLANLVKVGDTLAVGGWLVVNHRAECPYRLYQLSAAVDTIVWMDTAPC